MSTLKRYTPTNVATPDDSDGLMEKSYGPLVKVDHLKKLINALETEFPDDHHGKWALIKAMVEHPDLNLLPFKNDYHPAEPENPGYIMDMEGGYADIDEVIKLAKTVGKHDRIEIVTSKPVADLFLRILIPYAGGLLKDQLTSMSIPLLKRGLELVFYGIDDFDKRRNKNSPDTGELWIVEFEKDCRGKDYEFLKKEVEYAKIHWIYTNFNLNENPRIT